jgi:FkbM family methyltransferase
MSKVKEHLKNPPLSKSDLEKKIIIFPATGWTANDVKELENSREKIFALCDQDPAVIGQKSIHNGENYLYIFDTLSLEDVLNNHRDKVLLISIWEKDQRESVIQQLRDLGFPTVTDLDEYTFSEACAGNIHFRDVLYYLEKSWDFFPEKSDREVILNKALYRLGAISRTPFELPQYFIPFMDISEDEIFADCGFFSGDTAESYLADAAGKFKKYYAFEPNPKNIAMVKPTIKNDPRIEIIQAGVHSHCTDLMFSDERADASTFVLYSDKNTEVPVVSLDAFFADKEKPTFIKMDIEGSEISAILGAKTLIREHKPKLAVCLYHKPEDMIEIPRLIHEILPEYKMILKQHRGINTETVLYCKV